MLLRTSIFKTKKLLQKTIGSFKSLFSKESYEKLPKNPPCPSFPCNNYTRSHSESQEFYKPTSIKHLRGNNDLNKSRKKKNHEFPSRNLESRPQEEAKTTHLIQLNRNAEENKRSYKKIEYRGRRYDHQELFIPKDERVKRRFWVMKMLKELELMLDKSNEELVMDLEEIYHYYSRLTYPVYVDIVESFLFDLHSQLFTSGHSPTSADRDSWPQVK